MKTEIIKLDPKYPEADKIARCAKVIRQGGLVIFPTETVYGIAADYNNEKAMARLREVKKRPDDKLFSVHISQKGLLSNYTPYHETKLFKLVDECWPGPLTVIVPTHEKGNTIGIRMPHNVIALYLVQESQCTVAAPSANISGDPAPSTCEEALKTLDGKVDIAIDGGEAKFGLASSVVDFTQDQPAVVREGVVKQEEVDSITNKKNILFVCTGNSCRSVMAEYYFKYLVQERDDVNVYSAGTSVFIRSSASSETVTVLKREDIDASMHRSQPLTSVLLKKSDLILVMTRNHRQQVIERVPEVEQRVYLLREFGQDAVSMVSSLDIPDPMGKPAEAYEEGLFIIKGALNKLTNLI
ncbi:MAG: threonylcarbamoyl-AMP synthase [Candidatus Omnitrophica bacterium]|nr:threonylcarbamoyl-AMP synthase [Candidatus Omnitrophota bacterium]